MLRYLVFIVLLVSMPDAVLAEEDSVPSVEENLREMDKDGNGLVTVAEVRAYLQARHGAEYEKGVLDKLLSLERGASCRTPFAQNFY